MTFKKIELSTLTTADHDKANEIFWDGEYTTGFSSEGTYSEREALEQVGTYEIQIDSEDDYNRFMSLLNGLNLELPKKPTFEEWKENMISEGKRSQRLGKWLKKHGAPDSLVDFYSSQERTGTETLFLTVSDMPQHIAGMTYYAETFSSCQHPDESHSVHLSGAMHDNKLFVAMLHQEADDVDDMEGKLLARVLLRQVEINGTTHLLPTRYYGTGKTKSQLDRCLKALESLAIHSRDIREAEEGEELERITEDANGYYEMHVEEEVHVLEQNEHYIDVECPMCEGSGKYEVYSGVLNDEVKVECPNCSGHREVETCIWIDIDEYVTVEKTLELAPYTDDYSHHGTCITMNINARVLREWEDKYKKDLTA